MSHGLGVTPKLGPSVRPLWPNSGMRVLPMRMAPAARSRVTVTSSRAGTLSAKIAEPCVVRMPAVSIWSLTLTGTPCSGGSVSPAMTARSAAWASVRAWSAVTVTKVLRRGWSRSMAASTASTYSTGESFLRRIRAAAWLADRNSKSCGMGCSGEVREAYGRVRAAS